MKALSRIASLMVVGLLVGCAVTPDFAARPEFWNEKDKVIGVAVAKPPVPAAHKMGQQGLLDLAINAGMANELDTHLGTLDTSKINELATRMVAHLKAKGYNAKALPGVIDVAALPKFEAKDDAKGVHFATENFSSLKTQHGVDKLALISITSIGTIRNYYSFVPLGAPQGTSTLRGRIINLQTNTLEWNQAVSQVVPSAEAEWDAPPTYPGLTKAVYGAFEQSRDMLYNRFAQ